MTFKIKKGKIMKKKWILAIAYISMFRFVDAANIDDKISPEIPERLSHIYLKGKNPLEEQFLKLFNKDKDSISASCRNIDALLQEKDQTRAEEEWKNLLITYFNTKDPIFYPLKAFLNGGIKEGLQRKEYQNYVAFWALEFVGRLAKMERQKPFPYDHSPSINSN
jgi:hypothetical protein